MAFLFGPERQELKTRMELIIQAEEKTVKTIKKHILALDEQKVVFEKLIRALEQDKVAVEKRLDPAQGST